MEKTHRYYAPGSNANVLSIRRESKANEYDFSDVEFHAEKGFVAIKCHDALRNALQDMYDLHAQQKTGDADALRKALERASAALSLAQSYHD